MIDPWAFIRIGSSLLGLGDRESRRTKGWNYDRPALRLLRNPDAHSPEGFYVLPAHARSDVWHIAFTLAVMNEGEVSAKNWRVWFSPQDDSTTVLLDPVIADANAYYKDRRSGRRETILDAKARLQDLCVEPHQTAVVPGRHVIEISGLPSFVGINFTLDADAMPKKQGLWQISIDWGNGDVLWQERVIEDR